ncbi:MAG TPA: response regulator [Myxococcales bacterium]
MNPLMLLLAALLLAQPPPRAEPPAPIYFPSGSLSTIKHLHDFQAQWFGKALSRMEEPALPGTARGTKAYRFMILPTWGNPVAVRLTITGDAGSIEAKRLSGHGGYELGTLAEKGTVKLSADQVKEFAALFAKLDFFKMPTGVQEAEGFDGSVWILEAVEDGKHHVVPRWTAEYNTEDRGLTNFVAVCEWLYRASTLPSDVTNRGHVEILKYPSMPGKTHQQAAGSAKKPNCPDAGSPKCPHMKILFVENHADFAKIVAAKFLAGHEVTIVPSLAEARHALGGAPFDAVLVDYDLDDGKGEVLVRELRAAGNRVRTIGVSAKDEGNVALLAAGADAVVPKMRFSEIESVLSGEPAR